MKKVLFAVIILLGAYVAQAQGPGENQAKNVAEAAMRQCINDVGAPRGLQLSSSATVSTICDYMNPNPHIFGYTVTVWGAPQCPPNSICPLFVYLLGTVEVSCSGQVVSVNCGYN